MSELEIQAGLESLENSLKQMKALIAWEDLKQAEARPGQLPAFQVTDPTGADLRNEFSSFLGTLAETHTVLSENAATIPLERHHEVKRQLLRFEQQAQALGLYRRFWTS